MKYMVCVHCSGSIEYVDDLEDAPAAMHSALLLLNAADIQKHSRGFHYTELPGVGVVEGPVPGSFFCGDGGFDTEKRFFVYKDFLEPA